MSDADDLASAYLPDGVVIDDTTRHVAAQLALAWLQLLPSTRRLILEYEKCLDPALAAERAGLESARVVESILGAERVRQVMSLRAMLTTETIPPTMIGRVLTRIALGLVPANPHQQIRAAIELARVQGAYVPPQTRDQLPNPDETGLESLDQAAQDRIVQAAMGGGQSFADLLRKRAEDANTEAAEAAEKLAAEAELQSLERQAAEKARPAKARKFKARPAPIDPVLGTIPEHLANTDALAAARAKMKRDADG